MIELRDYWNPRMRAYEVWYGPKNDRKKIGIIWHCPGAGWITSATNGMAGPFFLFRWTAILRVIALWDGVELPPSPTYEEVMERQAVLSKRMWERHFALMEEIDALWRRHEARQCEVDAIIRNRTSR